MAVDPAREHANRNGHRSRRLPRGHRSAEREARSRSTSAAALALTGGLLALVYGIVTAGYLGWGTPKALTPIVIGVALLASCR